MVSPLTEAARPRVLATEVVPVPTEEKLFISRPEDLDDRGRVIGAFNALVTDLDEFVAQGDYDGFDRAKVRWTHGAVLGALDSIAKKRQLPKDVASPTFNNQVRDPETGAYFRMLDGIPTDQLVHYGLTRADALKKEARDLGYEPGNLLTGGTEHDIFAGHTLYMKGDGLERQAILVRHNSRPALELHRDTFDAYPGALYRARIAQEALYRSHQSPSGNMETDWRRAEDDYAHRTELVLRQKEPGMVAEAFASAGIVFGGLRRAVRAA